ncbi:hypothetical protein TARUN_4691 [Trichoderma arundinaceum]|uniref:SNF2 N-terminal domain-containing protein n=1 Tax=Trichoderma arundinaceum TaxID=490622 RepID=A0A395NNL6_TRIAR|nr:hypothetical protein TARUN_4691 [Trichoderma arundinaceum]
MFSLSRDSYAPSGGGGSNRITNWQIPQESSSLQTISPQLPPSCLALVRFAIVRDADGDGDDNVLRRGCLTQFLDRRPPAGYSPQHWDFQYELFLSFAESVFAHPPSGWTAIVDNESVSFQHAGTWAVALLLIQSHKSGNLVNMHRPDVIHAPAPLQQRLGTSRRAESMRGGREVRRRLMAPDANVEIGAAHSSPQPFSSQSSAVRHQATLPRFDAEPGNGIHAPHSTMPATPDETISDIDGPALELECPDTNLCLADLTPADGEHCDTGDAASDNHSDQIWNNGTNRTLQQLYNINSLQTAELDEACIFFCTTPTAIEKGVVLPGTSQSLSLPQLAFIFRFIKKSLDSPCQPQGQLLGDTAGMGKTHSTMGLIAVVRALMLSRSHVLKHRDLHNRSGRANPSCPAGNPYGIQCVCVDQSLGSRYVHRLLGGPIIILSPSHLVEQWVARAADYFLHEILPRGSQQTEVFVEVTSWRSGRLVSHQFDRANGESLDPVVACKSSPPSQLMVGITAEASDLSAYTVQQATGEPSYTDAMRRLRDENGVMFRPDLERA